jgi:hypothetical protein
VVARGTYPYPVTVRMLWRSGAWFLVPLGIWLLVIGMGNVTDPSICSDDYGCMTGGTVTRFGVSELILGSLSLLLALTGALTESGRREARRPRNVLLGLVPLALLFVALAYAASSPELNY